LSNSQLDYEYSVNNICRQLLGLEKTAQALILRKVCNRLCIELLIRAGRDSSTPSPPQADLTSQQPTVIELLTLAHKWRSFERAEICRNPDGSLSLVLQLGPLTEK